MRVRFSKLFYLRAFAPFVCEHHISLTPTILLVFFKLQNGRKPTLQLMWNKEFICDDLTNDNYGRSLRELESLPLLCQFFVSLILKCDLKDFPQVIFPPNQNDRVSKYQSNVQNTRGICFYPLGMGPPLRMCKTDRWLSIILIG